MANPRETYPATEPTQQRHWLLNKAAGVPSLTPMEVSAQYGCVLQPGLIKTLYYQKRKRYVWGTSNGNQTIWWVTQNHGFVYECFPYDRAAHLAYARRLAWLINANTYYIYLDCVRYKLPGAGPHRFLYFEDLVYKSAALAPEIKDDPEWEAPPTPDLLDDVDDYFPLAPSASYSSVISLADLFDVSTWVVYIPQGSDNRSVYSESDALDDRVNSKRIGHDRSLRRK